MKTQPKTFWQMTGSFWQRAGLQSLWALTILTVVFLFCSLESVAAIKCSTIFEAADEVESSFESVDVKLVKESRKFIPTSDLREAKRIAKTFNIKLTKRFRELPEDVQLSYLNEANAEFSKLPPIALEMFARARFKTYLIVGSPMTEDAPAISQLRRKIYPSALGMTNYLERVAYIRIDQVARTSWVTISRVLLHELGHVYD